MEAERRQVRYFASHLTMPFGTKGMCIISSHDDTSDLLLNCIGWPEQMFLRLNHGKDLVKVAHDAPQIHRANDLGMLGDSVSQFVIVHLHIVFLAVHHHDLATHVLCDRSGSRIGICRNNDLILRSDANQAERHFHGSRSGIQADSLVRSATHRNQMFKLFRLGASGNPTRIKSPRNLFNLSLRHVRR